MGSPHRFRETVRRVPTALRDAMEALALALVRTVRPCGRATGDAALVEAVDLTPTDFDEATEAGVIALAERVLRAAGPHVGGLPEDGDGDPAALRAATEAFRPARGARDATRSLREAKTRELPPLVDAAGAATTMLDDLVPALGDAGLAAEYRRARRIDDVSRRPAQPLSGRPLGYWPPAPSGPPRTVRGGPEACFEGSVSCFRALMSGFRTSGRLILEAHPFLFPR